MWPIRQLIAQDPERQRRLDTDPHLAVFHPMHPDPDRPVGKPAERVDLGGGHGIRFDPQGFAATVVDDLGRVARRGGFFNPLNFVHFTVFRV